jgi:hypothetical protein
MKKITLVLLSLILMVTLAFAGSKQVTFTWGQAAADLPNLKSWNIKYSMSSGGPYTLLGNMIYDGTAKPTYTSAQTITLVPDGQKQTIYFVATAVGKSGVESGNSNQVSAEFDFTTVTIPVSFTITIN